MTKPPARHDAVPPMELDPGRAVPVPETQDLEPHPDSPGVEPDPAVSSAPGSGAGWLLAGAVLALVALAVGFETADLLRRAIAAHPALGVLVAGLLGLAGVGALTLAVREVRAIGRLRRIDRLRAEGARLRAGSAPDAAAHFAGAVAALYAGRADLAPALDALRQSVTDAHDDAEVLHLVERQVLAPLDRRAYGQVLRAARDTAVATALSPAALLDVALVLWRTLRLVRTLATLYGARPGAAGTARLLRRVLANLAVAGGAESASDLAVDAIGGSLAAAVSARLGQGLLNGLLTARVGLATMELCRPLPFDAASRPGLGRIRRELRTLTPRVL